jgi:hypothetical protein
MTISPFPLHLIGIDLKALAPALIRKLKTYVELFNTMEQHGGWLPYPPSLREYFKQLGVMHWAELYSKDGQARYLAAHQKDLKPLVQYLVDGFGPDPTPESANRFLNQLVFELSTPAGQLKYGLAAEIDFLLGDLSKFDDVGLSDDERQQRRDIWLGYHVQFYNDLSIATHGESRVDSEAACQEARRNSRHYR